MRKELYTQSDYLHLTNEDTQKILKELKTEVPEGISDREYLYNNIELVEKNEVARHILSNKILAGRVSVKWYRFTYNGFSKKNLIQALTSNQWYDSYAIARVDQIKTNEILSIVSEKNLYTLRLLIDGGKQRITDGVNFRYENVKRSVVCVIDVDNCWIEVRANHEICPRIIRILREKLHIENIEDVYILKKYNGDIKEFLSSLENGFYSDYRAMPTKNFKLTEKDGIALNKIIDAIDDYFEQRDGRMLLDSLSMIDYETEGLNLRNILLAGLSKVSMKIRIDSDKDMTSQGLYSILKGKIIEDTSYIKFTSNFNNQMRENTIKVGRKSNSIAFVNSITENEIEYIRNKIL